LWRGQPTCGFGAARSTLLSWTASSLLLALGEGVEQQPDARERHNHRAPGKAAKQRIVDVLALVVIHDVEHPHEVEHAPQLMAPGQKLASNGREIEGGSIPMIDLDAPQRWLSTPDFPRHIRDEFGRCDRLGPG